MALVLVWADATPAVRVDTAVRVHIAVHPVYHSARVVLAHTSHPVAVAWTGLLITTDLTVLTRSRPSTRDCWGCVPVLREHSRVGRDPKPNGRDREVKRAALSVDFAGESSGPLPQWRCLKLAGVSNALAREGRWHEGGSHRMTQDLRQRYRSRHSRAKAAMSDHLAVVTQYSSSGVRQADIRAD